MRKNERSEPKKTDHFDRSPRQNSFGHIFSDAKIAKLNVADWLPFYRLSPKTQATPHAPLSYLGFVAFDLIAPHCSDVRLKAAIELAKAGQYTALPSLNRRLVVAGVQNLATGYLRLDSVYGPEKSAYRRTLHQNNGGGRIKTRQISQHEFLWSASLKLEAMHNFLTNRHNWLVEQFDSEDQTTAFSRARQLNIWLFQHRVMDTVLRMVCEPRIYAQTLDEGGALYKNFLRRTPARAAGYQPLPFEFSTALNTLVAMMERRVLPTLLAYDVVFNVPAGQILSDEMSLATGQPMQSLTEADINTLASKVLPSVTLLPDSTPLSAYLLLEAGTRHHGQRFGALGSILLASVLVGIIACDPESYWNAPGYGLGQWSPQDAPISNIPEFGAPGP